MAAFNFWLKTLALVLCVAAPLMGCQVLFGEFRVDDSAFAGAPGDGGSKGGAGGGAGEPPTVLIQVMPTSGLYTSEWGSQASFSIVLTKQPTSPVTIGLSSSDSNEGTANRATVTFGSADWNAPQLVTVTGVDDTKPDHNTTYQIITDPAASDDAAFNGANPSDVTLINIDDETAGVTVAPISGLQTSESGAQDTFTVVLNSKPKEDVTIDLTSSKPTEGAVSPEHVTFTTTNWMAPQLVTLTGVDDADSPQKDGPQSYTIVTSASASADPTYNGVEVDDVQVTNRDNETAGVTVVLVSGIDPLDKTKLRTSESGDSATFSVELDAPPSEDVTIPLASNLETEGQVSPPSLTFTPANWNAPQLVTVVGVDQEQTQDGDQPYRVLLNTAISKDPDYDGFDAEDVRVTNVDNDKAGFTLMFMSGLDLKDPSKLVTTEGGASATFTLVLNSKPSAAVRVDLSSSAPTEGSVTPISLTFTQDNWNAPQIVTVKGLNDEVADGNAVYYVRTGIAQSDDLNYLIDPPDVSVTNEDDDTAGVKVTLVTGIDPTNASKLRTSEDAESATFTVALTSQPTADVSIPVVSSNTKEGTVSTALLKFTKANYRAAQVVTITGVEDDHVVDGNQPYVINLGPATSDDLNFSKKFATTVSVSNRDNDSAAVIVAPTSGLSTSEAGKSATFTVRLQSKPTSDVTIALASNNALEGKTNVSSLLFTPINWNALQTVTITGQQDDMTVDGDQPYKIVISPPTSMDPNYGPTKLDPPDVAVTNLDDDSAGIIVTPVTGLVTSEDKERATFTVALQSRPKMDVKINLSSSRPSEGTVSPSTLTFTAANYNSPQTVTITGVDDAVADGPQSYFIVSAPASSADGNYNLLKAKDVSVSNRDNDSAGVVITPVPSSIAALTTEKGGTSTFTVRLNSQPIAAVSFAVTSTDTTEGVVSPASLSFTTVNWNAPQTVTVTGVDDKLADGDQSYKVHLSSGVSTDGNYSGQFPADLPFSNVDDDQAGLVINAAANLQTKETGTTATFTVSLLSQPTAAVSVALSSGNPAEGTVAPATLSFTTANWAMPQTVTITGVQDSVADGPQPYVIQVANAVSTDLNYKGKFGVQVNVTNLDDDQAGFTVVGSSLQTTEKGGKATLSVVLLSQPTKPVSLGVSSSDLTEGKVSPSSLSFTTANWSTPQDVTVTGVDDKIADGDQMYTVQFAPAVSGDVKYANLFPAPVNLTNADDDIVGVLVTPTTCATAPGTMATFSVVLTSEPGGDVTIPLSSDTPSAGTLTPDPLTLTFTPLDWNVEQIVTVTGAGDPSVESVTMYKIVTGLATSATEITGTGYDGYNPADVSCTNTVPAPATVPPPVIPPPVIPPPVIPPPTMP